jgi:photosystem II stability/assembly factor-like uncharacterized protein
MLRHEHLEVNRVLGEPSPPRAAPGIRRQSAAGGTEPEPLREAARRRIAALQGAGRLPQGPVKGAPQGVASLVPVSSGSNWVQLGPTAIPKGQTYSPYRVLVTGRVTAIVLHPNDPQTLYLGAAQGGVWKTTDGGKNWVARSDHEASLAIGALAMDPGNPKVLYAGTGEGNWSGSLASSCYYGGGVLKTKDGGGTWALQNPGGVFTGNRFSRIAVKPGDPNTVFAATEYGLFRTQDGGSLWKLLKDKLPANTAATDFVYHPTQWGMAYAAFRSDGIYKTFDTGLTWQKLGGGLPAGGFERVALGISSSSPEIMFALMSNPDEVNDYRVDQLWTTQDGGKTWSEIQLPIGGIGEYGWYNLCVEVDWATPDIVYLGATSVWKAIRSEGMWSFTDVGFSIHADTHALVVAPSNHQMIFAGNDGGIYRSLDGGQSWSDVINEGPCITQMEYLSQHPTSDAVLFCGTQDNGTEQFRNSPVFYHADDGDGGYTAVDFKAPSRVLSTYFGNTPKRSIHGGTFGTWTSLSAGLVGIGMFYPPMALEDTNPDHVAFGTDRINLDSAQGTGQWLTKVLLPGIAGAVSAIHYASPSLIYAGTTLGEVYRLDKKANAWTAKAIHASPLPAKWVRDIVAHPDHLDSEVIVVLSGFGVPHVWKGHSDSSLVGTAQWTDQSQGLPDIPANALVIEKQFSFDIWYLGTDVGIFRREGLFPFFSPAEDWEPFSEGLPNCAVFDLRLHGPSRLLRAATHGRGVWERWLGGSIVPDVVLFERDHLMDTARSIPTPEPVTSTFEDPSQQVWLSSQLWHWMCADIKVDAPLGNPPVYQMSVSDVDYVAFESRLWNLEPQPGKVNRVYVQVHNRGIKPAPNAVVKLLWADASLALPPLPADFWASFPGNSANVAVWKPIGAAKTLPSVSPTEPAVLEWDWTPPANLPAHSSLLMIIDCPADPIPAAHKIFDVDKLVRTERRVGVRNVHLYTPPSDGGPHFLFFHLYAGSRRQQTVRILPATPGAGGLAFLLPKGALPTARRAGTPAPEGLRIEEVSAAALAALEKSGERIESYDRDHLYRVEDPLRGGRLPSITVPKGGLRLAVQVSAAARSGEPSPLTIVQEEGEALVGGCTLILAEARG